MHKRLFLLLLILVAFSLVLYIKPLQYVITGLMTRIALGIDLSIFSNTEGKFIYFSYPSSITVGSTANFDSIFENKGSLDITERIEIHIKNSSLDTISSSYDDYYNLASLASRNFSTTWTPTSSGTYWVIARATYNSTEETKTEEINASFTVTSATTAETTMPVLLGGGGGVYPGFAMPVIIPKYNITLDYPKAIELAVNESSTISIHVTNTGNADLHNLLLLPTLEKLQWAVYPKNISVLTPNTTAIFLISIKVPYYAEEKNYLLDFTLISKEISEKGHIVIKISKMEEISSIKHSIENYDLLIRKIENEVVKAAAEGRNVTKSLISLGDARMELDHAKNLVNLGTTEALKHLELVRQHLITAVIELANSIIPRARTLIYYLILIVILAFLLVLVLLKKSKSKHITKPMKLLLKDERRKYKKKLEEIERLHSKKKINEKIYELKHEEIVDKIREIEEQIIMRFGDTKQKFIFNDLKKAWVEGIITKKVYIKAREKIADKILSRKINWI